MANLFIIRDIAERQGISLREVAAKIKMTEGGLQKLMANGSTNTSTIEHIANVLGVSAGVFFDGFADAALSIANGSASSVYGNATAGVIEDRDKEIEHLKILLEEKEKIINEKERMIQILIMK